MTAGAEGVPPITSGSTHPQIAAPPPAALYQVGSPRHRPTPTKPQMPNEDFMKRSILSLACLGGMILAQGASAASDQILPYNSLKLKYPQLVSWDEPMKTLWAGWKSRFVVGGQVQGNDPSGNKSVVSEGQAYGMMMALWLNDQATFNSIWAATEANMWNGKTYGWKASDKNSWAADADLDIAGMLIFASALVDAGHWTDYKVGANNYKAKALINLAGIHSDMIASNGMIKSGNWTGAMNPSYQEVHWYKVFAEFLKANNATDPGWTTTIYNGGYQLLAAQPSGNKGMARNFSTTSGGSQGDGTSMPTRDDMGFDACRVPYRVGLDLLWYNSTKAAAWAKGAWNGGIVTAERPGMYNNLSGNPSLWGWCDVADINAGTCTPQYEGFMTRAMWGASALGLYDTDAAGKAAFTAIAQNISGIINTRNYLSYYEDNATSKPSMNYFAQSLGLLGAIAMAGRAVNVWDDLKNPWVVPDTSAQITVALKSNIATINLFGSGKKPDTAQFTATLSRAATCTLMLTGATSGAKYRAIMNGVTSVNVKWNTSMLQSFTTTKFAGGETVNAELRVSGKPLPAAANAKTSLTIAPAVGVAARPVTATRAQWIGSELVLPQGVLRGASSATVRVLDMRGHVVAQGSSSVQADDRSTRLSITRPSGISGLFTLEVLADGEAFRASLAAF